MDLRICRKILKHGPHFTDLKVMFVEKVRGVRVVRVIDLADCFAHLLLFV